MGSAFRWLFIGVLCLPFCGALASKPYKPSVTDPLSEPWRWRHITPLDDAGFRCMAEGSGGTMWFGVNHGVLRYDGLRWTSFSASEGLTDDAVRNICRASDGSIYAASMNELWRFQDEAWTKLPLSMPIRCLSSSRAGIFVGTNFGTLHILGDKITLYSTRSAAQAAKSKIYTDFKRYIFPSDLLLSKSVAVASICEDHAGCLWIAVNQKQLVRFDPAAKSDDRSHYQVYTHKENQLLMRWPIQIRKDAKKQIWISTQAGVYRFAAADRKWVRFRLPESTGNIGRDFDLSFDKAGTARLAILNNLYVKRGGKWSVYSIPSQEQSPPHLLETADGCLWVGKALGKVFRIDQTSRQWQGFEDLHYQCDDSKNRSWFITSDNRAVVLSKGKWRSYSAEDGLMDTLLALYCSRAGQVWAVGSQGHTAATAYLEEGRWHRTKHESMGECFDAQVGTELLNGTMLFAVRKPRNSSKSGGVLHATRKKGGGFSFEEEVFPKRSLGVTGIAEDAQGDIYYAMHQLYRKQEADMEKVSLLGESESGQVECITTDPSQRLWVSIRDFGVSNLNGTNGISYTAKDGLGSSRISSLACAKDGTVWASMAHGFSRFDGQQWQPYVLDATLPGIPIRSGNLKMDRHDNLWMNTCAKSWYIRESLKALPMEDSQFSFKTVRYRTTQKKPETDLSIFSKEVSSEGNAFFEWSGVSQWESTPQNELTFSWRLGAGEWSAYSKKTNQLFLNLKPGTYLFEVRVRDRDFNVDPTPARCSFTVLAPVWQQTWFIAMVSLFALGISSLAYFLIRTNMRRMLEKQQHLTEMEQVKLQFFTSISHEFRTPLTVMLAPLHSLLDSVDDPKAKDLVRLMMRNAKKLTRLVDQVLDFRKLDAGRMPIEWARGDLAEFTATTVAELAPYAEQSGISVLTEIPKAGCTIWFDPDKWQKIVSNLLTNAIKYTPENGTVKVMVEIEESREPESNCMVVQVEDSGCGIPVADQKHIFKPYYRAKTPAKGTGIGLSFVKRLVDLLEGTITFESPIIERDGKKYGTRFRVELPLQKHTPDGAVEQHVEREEIDVVPAVKALTDNAGEKATVLIVDDSEDIRLLIQSELSEYYLICTAENGAIGFDVAKEKMPDLILSDLMMPVMDGLELCKKLKGDEVTSHIPVIMLTARSAQENELEGLHSGADDYISKPFTLPILIARIQAQLETRRRMRERFCQQVPFEMPDLQMTSLDQAFLERAHKIILDRVGDADLTSESFADAMGMKERTFRNKIKAITDLTPMALIRQQRLECAKQLLEQAEQKMTVSEIAASVGFFDASYFGKVFKDEFGKTPSQVMSRGG